MLGGIAVVYGGGLIATTFEYGAMVILLAVLALFGSLLKRPVRLPASSASRPVAAPARCPREGIGWRLARADQRGADEGSRSGGHARCEDRCGTRCNTRPGT